jgi:hypothetical protein
MQIQRVQPLSREEGLRGARNPARLVIALAAVYGTSQLAGSHRQSSRDQASPRAGRRLGATHGRQAARVLGTAPLQAAAARMARQTFQLITSRNL